MYLLNQLSAALRDLTTAARQRYTDGVMHSGKQVLYIVHRLHQTRQPDCEMARRQWLEPGEQCMVHACRALASLNLVRDHIGAAGLPYSTDWISATVTDAIRYLDHHMGPFHSDGSPAGVRLSPTDGTGSAALKVPCECDADRPAKPPVPNPSAN